MKVNRASETKTSFYVSRELLRDAKARAATEGIALRTLVTRALIAYLEKPARRSAR